MLKVNIINCFRGGGHPYNLLRSGLEGVFMLIKGKYGFRRKSAFTLAEVLITLGILGVVIAITLPLLMQSYKRYEYSAKIKKFYSEYSQAVLQAEVEYGSALYWERDASDARIVNERILPKLKYLQALQNISGGFLEVRFENGSKVVFATGNCIDMIFDANGNRKPNQYGIDRWDFLMCFNETSRKQFFGHPKKFFGPHRHYESREKALEGCKTNAQNCAGILELDNWEFKKDYPYHLR